MDYRVTEGSYIRTTSVLTEQQHTKMATAPGDEQAAADATLHAALQQLLLTRETTAPASEHPAVFDAQLHSVLQQMLTRGGDDVSLVEQESEESDVARIEDHLVVTDDAIGMAASTDTVLEGLDSSSSDFEQRADTKKRSQQHRESIESLSAKRPRQIRKPTYQTRKVSNKRELALLVLY